MAEDKPEDVTEAVAEDQPEAEQTAVVEEGVPNEAAEPETAADTPRKKSHWKAWLFLLLLLIGLPAAWFYSPAPLRKQVVHGVSDIVSFVQRQIHPKSNEQAAVPPAATSSGESTNETPSESASTTAPGAEASAASESPAPESEPVPAPGASSASTALEKPVTQTAAAPSSQAPATSPAEAESASEPAAEPVTSSEPAASTPAISASSKQVAALVEQVGQLRTEVADIQAGQAELRQQLQARQQIELRNRLRWLSRPGASLAQQAMIWGDIAALPDLDDTQRGAAEAMAKLALDDEMHVADWRKRLTRLAEKLPEARQADILPKPQNKYLAWLLDAFHLHHAPSVSEQQRAELGRRALAMAQALGSEDWPPARDWRELLADLHKQFGENTDLGLPESLDVQQHLVAMRQHAAAWLERL